MWSPSDLPDPGRHRPSRARRGRGRHRRVRPRGRRRQAAARLGRRERRGGVQRPAGRRAGLRKAVVHVPDAGSRLAKAALKRSGTLGAAVARTRDWVNAAPNELRPPQFADSVAAAAAEASLDVTVLDEKALAKGGY